MPTTFGRRAAPSTASRPPGGRSAEPPPLDPRLEALAASARAADPSGEELKSYLARRRAAIGPWSWVVNGLHVAAPVASYALHAPLPWIAALSAAGVGARMLLKQGRARWMAQLEAEARPDYSSTSKL